VKECILKATEILCPEKQELFKTMRHSANTVDLVGDIQCQLKEECEDFMAHSIESDESTDITHIAQLAVLFEMLMRNFK
jgi:hypothetical protein